MQVDPELYDASEEKFAASLEEIPTTPRANERNLANAPDRVSSEETQKAAAPPPNASWRDEVAARVSHYRSRRRPKAPRYPSLQLKFESPQPSWERKYTPVESAPAISRDSTAFANFAEQPAVPPRVEIAPPAPLPTPIEETPSNLIEFPRSWGAPPQSADELAGPVPDQLRIIEAPEIAPPPPALGGILIEPSEQAEQEKRPGFELPLQSSSMPRRILAAATDGLLVIAALALFGYIFFRVANPMPAVKPAFEMGLLFAGMFWMAYQYLFLVFTASTPGLRIAKLYPATFDGSYASRRLRRRRSLAAILSGASLCLGYLWCFLDEDRLCWHDRITRTHLAPRK